MSVKFYREISLSLIPSKVPPVLNVSQYDKGYNLIFNIIDDVSGIMKYIINEQGETSSVSAKLHGVKPSGETFEVELESVEMPYQVIFELTEDMTDEAGDLPSEIVFYQSDESSGGGDPVVAQQFATANVTIRVKESPFPADDNAET